MNNPINNNLCQIYSIFLPDFKITKIKNQNTKFKKKFLERRKRWSKGLRTNVSATNPLLYSAFSQLPPCLVSFPTPKATIIDLHCCPHRFSISESSRTLKLKCWTTTPKQIQPRRWQDKVVSFLLWRAYLSRENISTKSNSKVKTQNPFIWYFYNGLITR